MRRILFLGILALIFTSCGSIRQNNFSKQKFTSLKKEKHSFEEEHEQELVVLDVEPEDSTAISCDTLHFSSGKKMACEIISETDEEVEFTDCPPTGSTYKIEKMKLDSIIHSKDDNSVVVENFEVQDGSGFERKKNLTVPGIALSFLGIMAILIGFVLFLLNATGISVGIGGVALLLILLGALLIALGISAIRRS